ncbi:MAG: TauD/TfdA family dioxygenase [Pseudomonadota bacterium]
MTSVQHYLPSRSTGPFDLNDEEAYRRWRTRKLLNYPTRVQELVVRIEDPNTLKREEKAALLARCRKANMAVFDIVGSRGRDKVGVRKLGQQLGLYRLDSNLCADEDSITSLSIRSDGRSKGYIPYTNLPLNWHTDGYYNESDQRIRGMVLNCAQDAVEGGVNGLLDHEIAYILMRDHNPEHIRAFMHPEAMIIPANIENGIELRPKQSGPVFSMDPQSGNLLMRYTARTRNIGWRQDAHTQAAVSFLKQLLAAETPYIFNYCLKPGQGLICNNVLHNRSAFIDSEIKARRRLLFRARYYDRVRDTDVGTVLGD